MLPELPSNDVTINDTTYRIRKLALGESKEVLLRLFQLAGDKLDAGSIGSVLAAMSMRDLNFLQEKLLGKNCLFLNDQETWVPLGPQIVENRFAGHPGRYFNLLGQCLVYNYSDFLADLDLAALGLQIAAPAAE